MPLQVLLAEDNSVSQFVTVEMLKRLHCEVTVVGNGRLAVDALREREFDLVFMDCDMPVLDGFDATRAIRVQESGGGHPPPGESPGAHAPAGPPHMTNAPGESAHAGEPLAGNAPVANEPVAIAHVGHPHVGHPHVPIVAMTASALEGDRERCLEVGMDDFLPKPVRLGDLAACLERWRVPPPERPGQGGAP